MHCFRTVHCYPNFYIKIEIAALQSRQKVVAGKPTEQENGDQSKKSGAWLQDAGRAQAREMILAFIEQCLTNLKGNTKAPKNEYRPQPSLCLHETIAFRISKRYPVV